MSRHRIAARALLLAAALFALPALAGVCRVTTLGHWGNDGSDWTASHATSLKYALVTDSCSEIWVAKGVYRLSAASDKFWIQRPLALYGGFAGTEISRDQRKPMHNLSILSGDVAGDDSNSDGNHIDETSADIVGTNAKRVLYIDTALTALGSSTVVDGFVITAADGQSGLLCNGKDSTCSPTLANLVFSGNRGNIGGALYNFGTNGGHSNPMLTNVSFRGNSAQQGGAIYNEGNSGEASPVLNNVTFSGNSAQSGGAIYNNGVSGHSSPQLVNVTFNANHATLSGGAMYSDGSHTGDSRPVLTNVIAWGDTAASAPEFANVAADPSIEYSIVQGSGGSGSNWIAALGEDHGGNLDADPNLVALSDRFPPVMLLTLPSAAVDHGICAGGMLSVDQRGVARPQGATCDIGAIEYTDVVFADGFEVAAP